MSTILTPMFPADRNTSFDRLFAKYAPAVYRWVLFFGIDRASAEELTQEVFITAFRKLATVKSDAVIPAWLFQMTRRHAANHRRSAWVRWLQGRTSDKSTAQGARSTDDPDGDDALETRRILRKIPVKLVEVLILHDLDGYPREEISQLLGIPAGTVASRMRKARSAFARAWQGRGTYDDER